MCSAGHPAPDSPPDSLPLNRSPARPLGQPPSLPQGVLDTQHRAAQLQQEPGQVQGAAKPAAAGRSAEPDAPAPWQAAGGEPHPHQQQLPGARTTQSSMGAAVPTPECAAGPSSLAGAGKPAERPPQSPQQPPVRRFNRAWPVLGTQSGLLEQFWAQSATRPLLRIAGVLPQSLPRGACRCPSSWIRCCSSGMGDAWRCWPD